MTISINDCLTFFDDFCQGVAGGVSLFDYDGGATCSWVGFGYTTFQSTQQGTLLFVSLAKARR